MCVFVCLCSDCDADNGDCDDVGGGYCININAFRDGDPASRKTFT